MDADAQTRRRDRDVAVGRRIADLRRDQRLSQEELSAGVVSSSFISLVERGLRRPSVEHLEALAERLGTSLSWLADGVVQPADEKIGLLAADTPAANALLEAAAYFEARMTAGQYELRTWDVVQELRRQAAEAHRAAHA